MVIKSTNDVKTWFCTPVDCLLLQCPNADGLERTGDRKRGEQEGRTTSRVQWGLSPKQNKVNVDVTTKCFIKSSKVGGVTWMGSPPHSLKHWIHIPAASPLWCNMASLNKHFTFKGQRGESTELDLWLNTKRAPTAATTGGWHKHIPICLSAYFGTDRHTTTYMVPK